MSRSHGFAILAALLLGPAAVAQPPPRDVPPPPREVIPPPRPVEPGPTWEGTVYAPDSFRPGSAGPYGIVAESRSPLLAPDPVLLGRPGVEPGWYAAVTLGLVHAHLSDHVSSGTPLAPAFTSPVRLPIASLDWTVSPRFEIGYHLPGGRGDVRIGYRFLITSGSEDVFGGRLRSRLDLNAIDLDYVSPEWLVDNPLGPLRDLRLICGVRIATAYFDSTLVGGPATDSRFRSQFVGAGPRFGLEWRKPIRSSPLELYSRFETSGVLGGTRQSFAQSAPDALGRVVSAARTLGSQSDGVAVLGVEVGLAWRPAPGGRARFVTGYQFEQWWNIGRTDTSAADLTIQGIFWRGEWRY